MKTYYHYAAEDGREKSKDNDDLLITLTPSLAAQLVESMGRQMVSNSKEFIIRFYVGKMESESMPERKENS